jgi:hypothetical protein
MEERVGLGNKTDPEWQKAYQAHLAAWDLEGAAKKRMMNTVRQPAPRCRLTGSLNARRVKRIAERVTKPKPVPRWYWF